MTDISRRKAIKTIGATAAVAAVSAAGIDSMAEKISEHKKTKEMKVLLINGSPRQKGNTNRLLEEIASQLEKNGIGSEIFQVGGAPVRGCIECNRCSGLGKCAFDDDICNRVLEKMAESDALIVGSPVFYGTPAGQVLSLLQRMAFSGTWAMENKPAAVLTVCRRGGASAAFQALQMPLQMLNMPIVTSQYWNIAYGLGKEEVVEDAEGLQTMRTLADNMAYMLKQFTSGNADIPVRERGVFTNFTR